MTNKAEAWRNWWKEKHGNNMPMGGYHPMEGAIYDAFMAGWDVGQALKGFNGLSGYEVQEIEEKTRTKREAIHMTEEMLDEKNP